MMRAVGVTSTGLFAAPGPGAVPDFEPKAHLPDKKHAKLMSRAVQLGIAAVRQALANRPGFEAIPPERRGLFVGANPGGGDAEGLIPALEASTVDGGFSLPKFGSEGFPLVPPLWLVRGLTNNVVGYASAYHELRGPNSTRCDGRTAGLAAVLDGMRAVAEGRADLVVAGGADSLLHTADWLPVNVGEGGAFVVIEPIGPDRPGIELVRGGQAYTPAYPMAHPMVEAGAATGVIDLIRRLRANERGFRHEARDPGGSFVWLEVA